MADKTDISKLLERIEEDFDNPEDVTPHTIRLWLGNATIGRIRLAHYLADTFRKERQIALSFSIGEQFAKERSIILTEKVISKIYEKWGGRLAKAIVIRDNGKFKAWKYL